MSNEIKEIVHLLHNAHKAGEAGNHNLEGAVYLGTGFLLAPMLVGIPMMLYGAYKLCKK